MTDLSAQLRMMAGRISFGAHDAYYLREAAKQLEICLRLVTKHNLLAGADPDGLHYSSFGQLVPPLVIIESPYAGDNDEVIERNVIYARRAMYDSLMRGEAPFLSHLLYTQVLCDEVTSDRKRGIEAGLAWGRRADLSAVYDDFGISGGMHKGIDRAKEEGRLVVKRSIGRNETTLKLGKDIVVPVFPEYGKAVFFPYAKIEETKE